MEFGSREFNKKHPAMTPYTEDCDLDSESEIDDSYWSSVYQDEAHTYHPGIPHIAHKRLNYSSASTPPPRTKRAQLYAELDRINHRNFNDETRSIRAQTAALLKRVNTPLPRAVRPLPISGTFDHIETAIPERITSDDYISRMVDPAKYPTLAQEENEKKMSIGKGHLACMSYAGGRGYPRRKYLISPEEREEQRHIKDEILYRSYYDKFRTTTDDSSTPEEKGPGAH